MYKACWNQVITHKKESHELRSYFLTDEELSKLLKVSRRTLQEYRTLGVIPYYLVQGKALYKESDIQKVLDDAYKRCREEQRWV